MCESAKTSHGFGCGILAGEGAQVARNARQAGFQRFAYLKRVIAQLHEIDQVTRCQLELPCSDHAMVIYYQAQTSDVNEKVKLMALNHLINQDYFNELRTTQQLGYLVGTGYAPFNTRAGIAFYIQSPKFEAQTLLHRHNHFASQKRCERNRRFLSFSAM